MTEHLTKDERRDQIIAAAARLFTTKGFENSSVDEIAKEAGLSKGAIYWYFKSKLEILFGITDQFVEESQREILQFAGLEAFGPEALYKSHRVLWERMSERPIRHQLFDQLVSLSYQYPEIRERLAMYHREWDRIVTGLLDKGVAEGHFKPIDTQLLARAINALYDGVCVHAQFDPTMDPVAVIENATKLFYEALVQGRAKDKE